MLIDTHVHFSFKELGENSEESLNIIKNANENGVSAFINISTQESEFNQIVSFAESNKSVFASVGIHPCKVVEDKDITVQKLLNYAKNKKVIAIGECGLDYIKGAEETKELQKQVFLTHLQACKESGLPVIIHNRGADDDIYNILKQFIEKNGKITGVVHCFSSNIEFAKKIIELGFLISFTGIVTFKNAQDIQETAKNIPIDKILVETDSPYLAPVPYRGKENNPSYVKYVASHIAKLRCMEEEEFIENTYKNFLALFPKAKDFINNDWNN